MLANYHIHSTFCDGKNTPEEIVVYALEHDFRAIGFSGHGYTDYDLRYCMKDTDGYITEIKRLKDKYKKDIQVYLGIEEDMYCPSIRERFDYIIGSCHYIKHGNNYYPIDSNYDCFIKCLTLFGNDTIAFAEHYYREFCNYILKRKPNIIGHFDLITKFDEQYSTGFFDNRDYIELSKKYLARIIDSDCILEINTGAIARGIRSTPYPHTSLLYELKKADAKIMLSSDCHDMTRLDYYFDEARQILKDIGFKHLYFLCGGEFAKELI